MGDVQPMKRRGRKTSFERSITCPSCGKVGYMDRRQAKARIRAMEHRDGRLNAYRCPENPELWHVGHAPADLISGVVARSDLKPKKRQ